ncbi:MAG: hypothetical protein IPJ09_13165 [Saprospiraceae bacterium]|nr:hypothetical protein [Saprospiraceae bacterium]
MPVKSAVYFQYAYPVILLFILGMNLNRFRNEKEIGKNIIRSFKEQLDPKWAYPMILISIPSFYARNYMPSFLNYIDMLLFLMIFPALFILIFKKKKSHLDYALVTAITLWILYTGIKATMFTIVFYMGVTVVSVIFIGKEYKFKNKAIMISVALIITMTLQFTKSNFRSLLKSKVESEVTVTRFSDVFINNLLNIKEVLNIKNIFPLTLRFNNGFYLGLVMKNIPKRQAFDNGAVLGTKILSTLVPRLFWPSKPEAGGIANMKYYANLRVRHTVNVGPIGEAYGSFGVVGGIAFMFLFGLTIGFVHNKFIEIASHKPLLFMWMPLLFYETIYCMENDTMQALNSLVKITVFLYVLFKLVPGLLRPKVVNPGFQIAS